MNVPRWIVLCALVSANSWSEEFAPGPQFQIDSPTKELPDHLYTQPLTHPFEFRNTGARDLIVSVDKTSCGCTAAMVSNSTIPPGGSGCVRLTYTPEEKDRRVGKHSFSASLSTNDPACAEVVFEMKTRLTQTVSPTPDVLDFTGVATALPLTITCYHWNGPRKVLSIEPSSPAILVRTLPAEEVKGELTRYNYELTLSAAEPGKTLRAGIVVHTDSPELPVVEVPVRAEPPSRLGVQPAKLLFGAVKPGNATTRTVTLTPQDAQSAPARAQSEDPRIQATLEPIPNTAKFKLVATLQLAAAQQTTEKLKTSVEIFDAAGNTVGNVGVFALLIPAIEDLHK